MRTNELLNALKRQKHGVEVIADDDSALCKILYAPYLYGNGKTIFDAAFQVAKRLINHPDCPESVKRALEEYDEHSRAMNL